MSLFSFPKLSGCDPVKYPLSRTVTFDTNVCRFLDDSEQRFVRRCRQDAFAIHLPNLTAADRNTLENFWEDVRGPVATWSITIPETGLYTRFGFTRTVVYDGCRFLGNDLTFTEADLPERYTCSFSARQTQYLSEVPAGDPGDFPSFVEGEMPHRFQRPISYTSSMRTAMIDHPQSGLRWATPLRTTPIGPLHFVGLHTWKFTVKVSPSGLLDLENHFERARGRYRRFGFYAPGDGTASPPYYPDCRYGSDALEFVYAGPNDASADVTIEQVPPKA